MKSIANSMVIKEINTDIIRNALRIEKHSTKQKLSQLTGLSTVTIGTILNQLVANNEVFETDLIPSSGGRPAQSFSYNGEFGHIIVIYAHVSLGKDQAFTKVINLFSECIQEEILEFETLNLVIFESIIDRLHKKYSTIKAIGFGLPGVEYDGVYLANDFKDLKGTHFARHYFEKYKLPICIENDVNLAVLGYCYGNQVPEKSSVIYLYFPRKYNPGAGIYINGTLIKGKDHFAGEVDQLPLDINWTSIDYNSIESVSEAISKLILTFVCVINPDQIVLYGDFLYNVHLGRIKELCQNRIENRFLPDICQSLNFNKDFELGITINTLELIIPQL